MVFINISIAGGLWPIEGQVSEKVKPRVLFIVAVVELVLFVKDLVF